MTSPISRVGWAPALLPAEELDWDGFSARYFPERPRHDLEAVAAYGAYKQGRDWPNRGPSTAPPPRLTLVPNEPVPVPIEAEPKGTAAQGLLVAMPAVQVSEGDGGFTF